MSSAYSRVMKDVDNGKLSLKESVLIRAILLNDPGRLPADSPYRPADGEPVALSDEGTGLYKDTHRVFFKLTPDDRELLKAVSPELKAIIESREGSLGARPG